MLTLKFLRKEIEESRQLTKENVRELPDRPGIYIFSDQNKTPLYIGKSVSLPKRILSYLTVPLETKTKQMIDEANYFTTVFVSSELEALLLEAKLIKIFKPKYNIELKDDKHPLYIKITSDEYPRILLSRKADLTLAENKKSKFYGPFPSSANVKNVLKITRRIFPYATHYPENRVCIYSQIGLCRPCPSLIEKIEGSEEKEKLKKEYKKNIRYITLFLNGNLDKVKTSIIRQMSDASQMEEFEYALFLKRKLERILYVTGKVIPPTEFIANPNLIEDMRQKEMSALTSLIKGFFDVGKVERVECFDVAHLAGAKPTASMVTFSHGEPDKNLYRRFKINQKKGQNDIASLTEVAMRRERRLSDWGYPDLIIVDGGKGQTEVFRQIFSKHKIPVVGLAKRFETVVVPLPEGGFKEIRLLKGPVKNFFQRIRDEAHRFARSYHHKLIKKELLT